MCGVGAPSSVATALAGCCSAWVQCSERCGRPVRASRASAQSPTATTPGAAVAQVASVATPPATSRPLPASHSTLGAAPTPTRTTSAGSSVPSSSSTPSTRSAADQPGDAGAGQQADAVVGVQRADRRAHLGAERTGERGRHRLDDGDVEPERARARGDLGADEAGADDDQGRGARQVVAQRDGVVEGAQDVDAGERVVARATARAREPVASTTASAVSDEPSARSTVRVAGVERDSGGAEQPLDARGPRRPSSSDSSASPVLPVRKPLDSGGRSYGRCALGADDDDAAVEALRAQRPHGATGRPGRRRRR